jgi:hypothetical protein
VRFVRVGADCQARFLRDNTGRLAAARGAGWCQRANEFKKNPRIGQSFSHATHFRPMPARHPLRPVVAWRGHDDGNSRILLPLAG